MDDADTEEETVNAPDKSYLEEPEEVEYVMDDWPMKVHEGLYIGSCMAEMNKKCLLRVGITDILQVAQGLYPHHPLMFNYMNIQVQDIPSEDLVRFFPNCFEFIDRAISKGGAVLVHCAAGVSRSATVVLGYLMRTYKMDLAAAVDHLKAIRPWVQPNAGFLQQLEAYQGLSHDMTRWRAWQLVWKEQQQHGAQPQQQKQQWLQRPQVHNQQQQQQQGSNDTAAAAALPRQCGDGLDHLHGFTSSSGGSAGGGIGIQCSTDAPTQAAAAAAAVHQCALSCSKCCSGSRGDRHSSSSVPVDRAPSTTASACAATCAAAVAAANATVCSAAPAAALGAAAPLFETDNSCNTSSDRAGYALFRGQAGNKTSTSSSSSSSRLVDQGLDNISPPWQQQQQQQVESLQTQQMRHVDVADEYVAIPLGPTPAAAAAAEQQDSDRQMADAADMYEI